MMKSKISQNFIKAANFYFSFFRNRIGSNFYLISFFTFLAGIFDSVGILLFLPILQTINKDFSVGEINISGSSEFIINSIDAIFNFLKLDLSVLNILLFMCIAFLVKGIFIFLMHRYTALITSNLIPDLKIEFVEKIQNLDYVYFAKCDSGLFTNLVNEQINKCIISFAHFINTITHFLTAIMYVVIGFLVSPTFGFIAAIVGASIIIFFKQLSILVRRLSIDNSNANTRLTQLIIELVVSFKYLKATNSFSAVNPQIFQLVNELRAHRFKTGRSEAITMSVREPFLAITLALILLVQIQYFRVDVSVTLVAMILFYRGMNSTFNTQRSWQNTLEFSGSVDFLDFYLDDFLYAKRKKRSLHNEEGKWEEAWDSLKFEDVSFSYDEMDMEPLLDCLNLVFERNKLTVILGPSGSGKSTILDLITGLVSPSTGKISLCNKEGEPLIDAFDNIQFGFVSQDAAIFTDTIENNITLWNHQNLPKAELEKRLRDVLELAQLDDFVDALSDGLRTQLGDRGLTISGGQRQRIFIARELFKRPHVLILDEATSALDKNTEDYILQSISKLKSKTTIIFVTHRASIGLLADHVIELQSQNEINNNLKDRKL